MDITLECSYCGSRIRVSSLDQPPLCVETPADEHNPRRYAIYGGQSGWLLHRCDVLDLSEPERSEAKAPVGVR